MSMSIAKSCIKRRTVPSAGIVSILAGAAVLWVAACGGIAGAQGIDSVYRNLGVPSLGSLVLQSTDSVVINTGTTGNPTMTVNGTTTYTGTVLNYGTGVAVFYFDYLKVPEGVAVSVSGQRPLSIVSDNDMVWGASVTVPPGNLGGGAGGAGGTGSAGGDRKSTRLNSSH